MSWIDYETLPSKTGTVERFLPNADGGIDGLILGDGTEIHLPSNVRAAVAETLPPGTEVRLHGLKPRDVAMLSVVAIGPMHGEMIVDEKAAPDKAARKALLKSARAAGATVTLTGRVKQLLHGARGEINGALLEDGKVARLPPTDAKGMAQTLTPGAELSLEGLMLGTKYGDVMVVSRIGAQGGEMSEVGKARVKATRTGKPAEEKSAARTARVAERKTAKLAARKEKQGVARKAKQEASMAARKAVREQKRAATKESRQAENKAERAAGGAARKAEAQAKRGERQAARKAKPKKDE